MKYRNCEAQPENFIIECSTSGRCSRCYLVRQISDPPAPDSTSSFYRRRDQTTANLYIAARKIAGEMSEIGLTSLLAACLLGLATTSSSLAGAALGLDARLSERMLAYVLGFAASALIN